MPSIGNDRVAARINYELLKVSDTDGRFKKRVQVDYWRYEQDGCFNRVYSDPLLGE